MKHILRSTAALSALVLSFLAISHAATVDVPFDFQAKGISFPAGQYDVNQTLNHGFLVLQSKQVPAKHLIWVAQPSEASTAGDTVLSFDKSDGTASLRSIQYEKLQVNLLRAHTKEVADTPQKGGAN